MEAAGLAVGIVALISSVKDCIDVFQYFTVAKSLGHDFEILSTKLDVEKVLLLQWVQRTRLLQPGYDRRLDDPGIRDLVTQVVSSIMLLLSDTKSLQDKYGVRQARKNEEGSTMLSSLGSHRIPAFARNMSKLDHLVQEFKMMDLRISAHKKTSSGLKGRWPIRDKDQFGDLLRELSYFVSRLNSLVPDTDNSTQRLIEEDVRSLSNQRDIRLLSEGTAGRDDILAKTAEQRHIEICEDKILRCVWYRHMDDRETQLAPPNPQTFEWALDSSGPCHEWDSLPHWLSDGSGVYWICGKGKYIHPRGAALTNPSWQRQINPDEVHKLTPYNQGAFKEMGWQHQSDHV